ncbi:PepSY domain-containing protein [Parapusillimonas sp. SGNA-6]|nr:PepSY domain-containing protein [Parapusillimonas sp. SGNA-6]
MPRPVAATPDSTSTHWLLPLIMRLHFFLGVAVGPFLLVAALSGIVYALTPQIEEALYRHELHAPVQGAALPLARQIEAARTVVGQDASVMAVRPAPKPGDTTRVMFRGPDMGPSESRAIFVDPTTAEIRGDLGVYGTSGVLPVRSWLDQFHRGLKLGDIGRLYSELAASWLWIIALGGVVLWARARRRRASAASRKSLRHWHGALGLWVLVGLLFFSATGLTWSQWAGGNISVLRARYGWGTPTVATTLPGAAHDAVLSEHAHHHGAAAAPGSVVDPVLFDAVLQVARAAGIDAGKIEIRPPAAPGKAWTVTEIDRSWPTQVDAVSIDPRNMAVLDRTRFDEFPLAAKLTRWGIDAHMGSLFGLANQLVLVAFASGLVVMVVLGYAMWWRRRPTRSAALSSLSRVGHALRRAPPASLLCLIVAVGLVGWFLPVMGGSLILFVLVDVGMHAWRRAR